MKKRIRVSPLIIDVDEEIQLRIRLISESKALYDLVDQNRRHLRTWFPWVDQTNSENDIRRFIERGLEKFESGTACDFGIYYKGIMVGSGGFNTIDSANKLAIIGYWLDKKYQGYGIITRAMQKCIELARERYDIHRFELLADVDNDKSNAVAERLGFTLETIQKESRFYNGKFHSMKQWSLVQDKKKKHKTRN